MDCTKSQVVNFNWIMTSREDLSWGEGAWCAEAPPPSLVSTLPLNFVSWKRHWPGSGWQAEDPDGENGQQGSYSSGIKR